MPGCVQPVSTHLLSLQADEARLQEIIQPQAWQRVSFGDWIEQARLIVEGSEEKLRSAGRSSSVERRAGDNQKARTTRPG
jgi:hypothetical protein